MLCSNLFSISSSELPIFMSYFLDRITIPVVEEMFFLLGIPYIMIKIFDALSNLDGWAFFENPLVKFIVVFSVSIPLFIIFHIPLANDWGFIFGAFVFRMIAVVLVWGDELLNIVDTDEKKTGVIAVLPSGQ